MDDKNPSSPDANLNDRLSLDEMSNLALESGGQLDGQFARLHTADNSLVIANQPRVSARKIADTSFHSPFNEAHSERDWTSGLCTCGGQQRSCLSQCCCWPAYRYSLATRLGETPFMPLIPCAAFGLRVKIRTLFGIKGSLIKDLFAAFCCEPCAICQMTRELDRIGL